MERPHSPHSRRFVQSPYLFERKQPAAMLWKNWRDDLCVVQFLNGTSLRGSGAAGRACLSIPDGERRYIISPLLILNDYLRCSFVHFDLRAHPLQARSKCFNLVLLARCSRLEVLLLLRELGLKVLLLLR